MTKKKEKLLNSLRWLAQPPVDEEVAHSEADKAFAGVHQRPGGHRRLGSHPEVVRMTRHHPSMRAACWRWLRTWLRRVS